jgi:hypothetical protein
MKGCIGRTWAGCFSVAVAVAIAAAPAFGQDCEGNDFPSTFAAIQKVIFENRGCTESVCHGGPAGTGNGGLDLRPDVAYENLVNQPSQTVPGWFRVFPGQRDRSLLFVNVAAKTMPDEYTAPLRPMPLDPVPPISTDELEALRRWVETGASRDGVVPGTDELLDACLPPPRPIEIDPLPPPPPGEGAQIHMPRWVLEPESEHEVCYTTYYDITDQVPEQFRGPNGDTVRYQKAEVRQDPLSHHLIVNLYTGPTPAVPTAAARPIRRSASPASARETCPTTQSPGSPTTASSGRRRRRRPSPTHLACSARFRSRA